MKYRSSKDCACTPNAFADIRAVAMDVDGVLTDGHFFWDATGTEMKRFCVQDATGISIARDAGVSIALISGESSPCGMALVQRYANKLKLEHAYKGCHDKAAALRDFAARSRVPLAHICYIGDDAIDLAAMAIAGLPVAPANAHHSALAQARFVTTHAGGDGAVREVMDLILRARSERK